VEARDAHHRGLAVAAVVHYLGRFRVEGHQVDLHHYLVEGLVAGRVVRVDQGAAVRAPGAGRFDALHHEGHPVVVELEVSQPAVGLGAREQLALLGDHTRAHLPRLQDLVERQGLGPRIPAAAVTVAGSEGQ